MTMCIEPKTLRNSIECAGKLLGYNRSNVPEMVCKWHLLMFIIKKVTRFQKNFEIRSWTPSKSGVGFQLRLAPKMMTECLVSSLE